MISHVDVSKPLCPCVFDHCEGVTTGEPWGDCASTILFARRHRSIRGSQPFGNLRHLLRPRCSIAREYQTTLLNVASLYHLLFVICKGTRERCRVISR